MTPFQQQTIAMTIHTQLGGRQFTLMTGSSCYTYGLEEHEDVEELTSRRPYLLMNLARNASPANRLCIYYNPDDTYTMRFYKELGTNAGATYEQEFNSVYCKDLQRLFTEATGLYTTLCPTKAW